MSIRRVLDTAAAGSRDFATLTRTRAQSARSFLIIALMVGLVLSGGPLVHAIAQRASSMDDPSYAQGDARVMAQGVAELPEGEVVWRALRYRARPRAEANPGGRVPSFLIASENPILVSNTIPETPEEDDLQPIARLAVGEAIFTAPPDEQQRASVTDEHVNYVAIELVRVENATKNAPGGTILVVSDPFEFASDERTRDFDLVGDVLQAGESALVPAGDGATTVFATDGAIDVIPVGGGRRIRIEVGQATTVIGEFEVRPVEQSSSLPRMLGFQDADDDGAAFVAAMIGPSIPPPPPTIPSTLTPIPTEPGDPSIPTATPVLIQVLPTDTPAPEAPPTEPFPTEPPVEEPTATLAVPATEVIPPTEPPLPPTEPVTDIDPDQDGLSTREEIGVYKTNPAVWDSDGDGSGDGDEVRSGTDPNNPRHFPPG